MNRLVIDTDPGVDDAHAILMALASPEAEVVALTTVAGNVNLDLATRNAHIIVGVAQKEVPIYRGCEDALVVPTARRAISHGTDGLGEIDFAGSIRAASTEHAALALIRLASEAPGELTLVALGPLTNVALATRLDPQLPQKYRRLIIMGGAVYAQGNSWERTSEFNFYCDPEAAAIVFSRWPQLTLIPWETALRHALTADQVEALLQIPSPRAEFFRQTIRNRMARNPSGQKTLTEPDPLAMAVALDPQIVTRAEHLHVEIELAGNFTRGQCVVDWSGLMQRPANTQIILEVDQKRFFNLMQQALR